MAVLDSIHGLVHGPSLPRDGQPFARRWLAVIPLCLIAFASMVDNTIVGVAVPAIIRDFGATQTEIRWIFDSFVVVLAGLIVFGGGLGDRYGRRRMMMLGSAVFGVATLLGGLSGSPEELILWRAVMGLGAALTFTSMLSSIAVLFAEDERAKAAGLWMAFSAVGMAGGPVLGGVLVDSLGWRWVFFVNVPVVVAALVLFAVAMPESRRPGAAPLDIVGAALSLIGLTGLVYGLIQAPADGWGDPAVLGGLAIGVVGLVAFVVVELRRAHPLLDLRILRVPAVAVAALALMVVYVVFLTVNLLIPQELQTRLGYSAAMAGVLMIPLGAALGVMSRFASTVIERLGVRRTIIVTMLAQAVGALALALPAGYATILPGLALYGGATAVVGIAATIAIMNALPVAKAGDGSAVSMTSRQLGAVLGIAVFGSLAELVQTRRAAGGASAGAAFDAGLLVALGLASVTALVVALLAVRCLPRSESACAVDAPIEL